MNSKTASTSERIDGLEARCQALESIVEQLTAGIEMLEAPTTVTPVPDIDVVGSLAPGGGTTEGTPLDVTETHQGSVDIDDLLREAQQMGRGIYEDIQEVINLCVMQPPTTDVRLDVEDYCLFGGGGGLPAGSSGDGSSGGGDFRPRRDAAGSAGDDTGYGGSPGGDDCGHPGGGYSGGYDLDQH